jgi:hypothetical protein
MGKNIIALALIIFVLFSLGCERKKTTGEHSDTNHGHHDEDELTIAQTVWTDRTELFVEFPVLIVGEEAVFLAHYTYLADFKPVQDGKLEVKLSGQTTVADKPARSGIFLPKLVPHTAGVYDLTFCLTTSKLSDTQTIHAVRVYSSQEDAQKNHPIDKKTEEGVVFLKEQQWQIDFATIPAQSGRLASTIKVSGQVKPFWNCRTVVLAPFAGRVDPPGGKTSIPVLGQEVTKGELLGELVPSVGVETKIQMQATRDQMQANRLQMSVSKLALTNLQRTLNIEQRGAKLKLAQSKLELEQSQRDLERIKRLRAKNGATEKELQMAELTAKLMEEAVQAASDQLKLYPANSLEIETLIAQSNSEQLAMPEATSLLAPISGTVVEVSVANHEYKSDQSPLFTLVDWRKVLLEGYIYEHDVEKIKTSPGVFASIPGQKQPAVYIAGKPEWIGMVVDNDKRTVPVLYTAENTGQKFRINGNIELAIETEAVNSGVIIPEEALLEEAGLKMVFVQVAGELFEKRPVQIKLASNGQALVANGVAAGERVVTRGAYIIWLSTKSSKLTSGHGHPH